MRIGVLVSKILGEGSLEALDGRALRIVDNGLTERNGVVKTLEDRIAVTGVAVL
jgi:hypothetical protein